MTKTPDWGGGFRADEELAGAFSDHDTASPQTFPIPRRCVSSQQVSWWEVHEFVAPVLARVGSWPMVGTPQWCALPDDDPTKIASIFDAAQHWALRLETCQQASCEASHTISAAVDWGQVAQQIRDRGEFQRDHPWAVRTHA